MHQILGNMDSDAKVYKLEDVSKHKTHEDCWLVIGGKVCIPRLDFHCQAMKVLFQVA